LQAAFGFRLFTTPQHQASVEALAGVADQTDKGIVLANALVARLRAEKILLPSASVIERVCAQALTGANRRMYAALTAQLMPAHWRGLDALLKRRDDSAVTWLAWLRQSPAKPNSRHMLDRFSEPGGCCDQYIAELGQLSLPTGVGPTLPM